MLNSNTYSISFALLVPKWKILRGDVLPFVVIYTILGYVFWAYEEDDDMNLYIRLTAIAAGFVHCLMLVLGYWSKDMYAWLHYKKLTGNLYQNLYNATHVFIKYKREGYTTVYGIAYLGLSETAYNYPPFYGFHFQLRTFYYDYTKHSFTQLKPFANNSTIGDIINSNRQSKMSAHFNDNILYFPRPSFWHIFQYQLIDPFMFFQLVSSFLWMLDNSIGYCIFTIGILLCSAIGIAVQRIKSLVGFRSMTLRPHYTYVWVQDRWQTKSSYELVPGNIIAITSKNYHKAAYFFYLPDEYYLKYIFPKFLSHFVGRFFQQTKTTHNEDNHSYKNVSCDILLLSGTCVVNESIMTGEAIPQIKYPIVKEQLEKILNVNADKTNLVFCGTEVEQVSDTYDLYQLNYLVHKTDGHIISYPPKQNCCIGMVLKTGFDTSKGKLMRKVMANTENIHIEQKDGLWILFFLFICSLITAAYVLIKGMYDYKRNKYKLFLRCIAILTCVIPPELPMLVTIAVNNSILYLRKRKIFVTEPKKIPLGGKVKIIAFDKTGTLTEDRFIFQGIVDDCQSYQMLKNFKNCSNYNKVVLAGCHSLLSLKEELTGDPIEKMFFELTDWHYNSKDKYARRIMERVFIKKVYPFRSELKRMSTVVEHVEENGRRAMKGLVKGAPYAIEELLQEVPGYYRQAYTYYTKQGFRLLALASKKVDLAYFSQCKNKTEEREYIESQLTFVGFFICSSPLKADTIRNIYKLQYAKYKILIITGDNILTANKVGLLLHFGYEAWSLDKVNDSIVLYTNEGVRHKITSLNYLQQRITNRPIFLSTCSAKDLPHYYYDLISIFARTSPHDKETIVKYFKEKDGILYAGDGTNDVGGLRMADVGVAVVGTTNLGEIEDKENRMKEAEVEYQKKLSALQQDFHMPFKKKFYTMSRLTSEHTRRKMYEFVNEDEIKVGDACIAAPFTSKHSNSIKCVLIIVRQAIATLVTTIRMYKILAISSILQAYGLAYMNLVNLKYSYSQMIIMSVLTMANFYNFTNAKPLKKISPIRAPSTIFTIWFAINFFGQIILFCLANYYVLNHIGVYYVLEEDKHLSADAYFKKSFINTTIFLFSCISQCLVFLVNHGGEPHMESLLKSPKYFKILVIPIVLCFVLTLNIFPDLSTLLSLKFEGVPFYANLYMLKVFGLLVLLTYSLDRLCRYGQFRVWLGWI